MPAKLIVTTQKGGSQVALIGPSGKQLLTSVIFREPRAKGATVRALKSLLGEQVTVEDSSRATGATSMATRGNGRAGSRPQGKS